VLVALVQAILSLVDLLGVAIIGVVGAIAATGIESRQPGSRANTVLKTLHLGQFPMQTQVAILGSLAVVVLTTKTIFSMFFTRRVLRFLSVNSAEISINLVDKLFGKNILNIRKNSTQQLIFAITSGVNAVSIGVIGTLLGVITDTALFIVMTAGLFIVDPILALTSLLLFSSTAFALYRSMQNKARLLGIESSELSVRTNETILEALETYREASVKNRKGFYSRSVKKDRVRLALISAEQSFMPNISKYVLESLLMFGILIVSGIQFLRHDATHAIGILTIFAAAGSRIAPAVLRIQQSAIQIKSSLGAANLTLEVVDSVQNQDTNESPNVPPFSNRHTNFDPKIEIKGLNFTYSNSEKKTINNINLEITSGSILALVGKSGAGKSTLADLILGVICPDEGNILISGLDPNSCVNTWPGSLAYVPQDIYIANKTIRENVCLGFNVDEVEDELVWNALKISQLYDLVTQLPKGLDTLVGERGSQLSGGQRQRLGIARALITNPRLLVLDEATSALDSETELAISNAIKTLRGNTTIIIIAHRLSTVRDSDLLAYLENGEVVSIGNFDQVREQVPNFDSQAKLMGL
jgi:ABC-type multidrug transport system fused ATPase/permease subunit